MMSSFYETIEMTKYDRAILTFPYICIGGFKIASLSALRGDAVGGVKYNHDDLPTLRVDTSYHFAVSCCCQMLARGRLCLADNLVHHN